MLVLCKIKYRFGLLGGILLLGGFLDGCVKSELQNITGSTTLYEDVSVPIGTKEIKIDPPDSSEASTIPAINGSYFYNGVQYPNRKLSFNLSEAVDFNLNNLSSGNTVITYLDFSVIVENSFPTTAQLQVTICNGSKTITHLLFKDGPISIPAAEVDSLGNVIKKAVVIPDVTALEEADVEKIKTAGYLLYNANISTVNTARTSIIITDQSSLSVCIAARLKFKYKVTDNSQ
jgi:hypothetical protein